MALGASEAARWQAYQTRARMSAQLWFRVFVWMVLGWIALTVYVVWHETGVYFPQIQHAYFWRWMLCGILLRTPLIHTVVLRCSLPANGAWYQLGPLADWMNGPQMYYRPFSDWFWHYAIRTALVPIAFSASLLVWRARRLVDAEHIRGLRLLPPTHHNRQLNGGWLTQALRGREEKRGIKMGDSVIPEGQECEHLLLTGSPGAGKTTAIRHMLIQIKDRGQSTVILDPETEYIQEFYEESRGDVVLNPLDARCPFWTPWLEFRDASFTMDAEAMAASLIRRQPRTPTEAFFLNSGRTLIEAILETVQQRDNSRSIIEFLAQPREKMHAALKGTRAYQLLDPGAHEQGAGILGVVTDAVKGFYHLPLAAKRRWSAREWAQSRKGWIFLPSTEDTQPAIQGLQGVWLDCLVRWLMSAEIGSGQVWIMADELPALGYQPQIEKLVTRGRKRGLAVVMGFQNVSQLRSIYGRDGAVTLTSSPTTKVILRCDEAETAKWASELLGDREIERMQMTQLAGLSTYREGINLQPHRSIEHLVLPAQIQRLAPFTGYLCVAGHDRTTIRIPERHLEKHHPAFVPRTQINGTPAVETDASEARWSGLGSTS